MLSEPPTLTKASLRTPGFSHHLLKELDSCAAGRRYCLGVNMRVMTRRILWRYGSVTTLLCPAASRQITFPPPKPPIPPLPPRIELSTDAAALVFSSPRQPTGKAPHVEPLPLSGRAKSQRPRSLPRRPSKPLLRINCQVLTKYHLQRPSSQATYHPSRASQRISFRTRSCPT